MEQFLSNPGLPHLAENVFWNLDVNDLKICAQINQTCKQMLQNMEKNREKLWEINKKGICLMKI